MKKTSILTMGLVLLASMIFGMPFLVAAKAPPGIQVTPLRTYPALDRGSTGTGTLTLTNTTAETQSVSMSIETFQVHGEDYEYSFSDGDETKWITFAEPHAILAPNQSKVMTYSVAVPGDAAAGGHYFSLITSIDPPKGTNGITEIKRIASLLYLEVSGSITKRSSLTDFSTPWFTLNNTINSEAHVANNGTSHIRARVLVETRSRLSLGSAQSSLLEATILPSTLRKLSGELKLPKTPGIYQVTASYSPAQGGNSISRHTVIYAPVWFLVVLGLGLVSLGVITFRFLKDKKKT